MPELPLVSVIVPAYNTAPLLIAAVRSALSQTVADVEVIVVDDGSTDGTLAQAKACADGDRRVRVLTQTNAGTAAARNAAMAVARGTYFALLDSDDEWMPTFLERQLAILARSDGPDVVSGNAFNRGGPLNGHPVAPAGSAPREVSLLYMIEHEDAIGLMSVFRRDIYRAIGGFDQSLRVNEDYEFWLRAAVNGFRFVRTYEPLGFYLRRRDAISADDLKMVRGILRVYRMMREHCPGGDERSAIDRQIKRFERERLGLEGRTALTSGEFQTAVECYRQLYRMAHTPRMAALFAATRYTPGLLRRLVAMRGALRRIASPAA